MMIKINPGTEWEYEIDPTITVGDYVQLTRVWSGRRAGVWEVVEFDRIFVDPNNMTAYGKVDFSRHTPGQGYHRSYPPMGMEMPAGIRVARVMGEWYEKKPRRRDTTETSIEKVDKITPQFIADTQAKYDARTKNLTSLINGTW